jgi:DNA end-binding protein Ku
MPASVWKGYLSFGLVSFPVRLAAAARPETIHFRMLHRRDLSRVKEVFYCAAEDKPLNRADIVKGYEYRKGQYVVVTDEELKKIAPSTEKMMEIIQFVPASDIDPLFFEKSYYVAPEELVSKPYSLLRRAMTETGYYALAKLSMHNREHVVVLRPASNGLVLHTMFYKDELHEARKPKLSEKDYTRQELQLAEKLIHTLAAPFKPEKFHDTYRENVEKMIEQKRHGRKVTAAKSKSMAPVIGIMEALEKSLAQNAKAPRSAAASKSASTRKAPRKYRAA